MKLKIYIQRTISFILAILIINVCVDIDYTNLSTDHSQIADVDDVDNISEFLIESISGTNVFPEGGSNDGDDSGHDDTGILKKIASLYFQLISKSIFKSEFKSLDPFMDLNTILFSNVYLDVITPPPNFS